MLLARSYRSGSPEIWLCDSDGSHPEQLTSFGGPATNRPRWSPDGKQIVFYSDAKGNRDIYVIRADGSVPKQLTTNLSIDTNPGWSADGKWIYFSSERGGQHQVWKVPVEGGEAVPAHGRSAGVNRSNHPTASSFSTTKARPIITAFGGSRRVAARKLRS